MTVVPPASTTPGAPLRAALLRAIVAGLLTGVSTALATWQTTTDLRTIFTAAAVAFLAPFLARWGGEGIYDEHRASKGAVSPADVQAGPNP